MIDKSKTEKYINYKSKPGIDSYGSSYSSQPNFDKNWIKAAKVAGFDKPGVNSMKDDIIYEEDDREELEDYIH